MSLGPIPIRGSAASNASAAECQDDPDPAEEPLGAPEGDSPYKSVRGLSRGLAVLRALNRFHGGANIVQLAQACGLHRTTVRRLLETLQGEGLVRRSVSSDDYSLTIRVRELSEGFRDEEWISSVSGPILAGLLEKVLWPTDICTLDGDAMIIRETTHRFSRLSFHRAMVGRRLPLLQTAAGRTYLAYCSSAERDQLLALLAESAEYGDLAKDSERVLLMLERIRYQGYGDNHRAWPAEEKVAAIAVPLRVGQQLLGCLNLVYFAKAMSTAQAAERYLPDLMLAAREIEKEVFVLRAGQVGGMRA